MTEEELMEAYKEALKKSLFPLVRQVALQTLLIRQMAAYRLTAEDDPRVKAEQLRDDLVSYIERKPESMQGLLSVDVTAECLVAEVRQFYEGLMQKRGASGDDDWGLTSVLKQ